MDLFPHDTKDLAWKAWRDRREKTSSRLACLAIYGFFRVCEIIDFWFPVKIGLKEAREIWGHDMSDAELKLWVEVKNRRAAAGMYDNEPKGETRKVE